MFSVCTRLNTTEVFGVNYPSTNTQARLPRAASHLSPLYIHGRHPQEDLGPKRRSWSVGRKQPWEMKRSERVMWMGEASLGPARTVRTP